MAKTLVIVVALFLLRAAVANNWNLDVVVNQNHLPDAHGDGKCYLSVERDVKEVVTVQACDNAKITVNLNNEYRARCENWGHKCRTLTSAYDVNQNNWMSYPWACVPVPVLNEPSKVYTTVTHNNFPINSNGCNTFVTIKYINATNCGCLPLF